MEREKAVFDFYFVFFIGVIFASVFTAVFICAVVYWDSFKDISILLNTVIKVLYVGVGALSLIFWVFLGYSFFFTHISQNLEPECILLLKENPA